MTVVAWDGVTLAADKRFCQGSTIGTCTKAFKVRGHLVAFSGSATAAAQLLEWFAEGADPERFLDVPDGQETDMIVITPDRKILLYEDSPFPMLCEDKQHAIGSGANFAAAAMYCGENAVKAVEVACALDAGCGNGITVLTLEDD